jgi:hypothetical protein
MSIRPQPEDTAAARRQDSLPWTRLLSATAPASGASPRRPRRPDAARRGWRPPLRNYVGVGSPTPSRVFIDSLALVAVPCADGPPRADGSAHPNRCVPAARRASATGTPWQIHPPDQGEAPGPRAVVSRRTTPSADFGRSGTPVRRPRPAPWAAAGHEAQR